MGVSMFTQEKPVAFVHVKQEIKIYTNMEVQLEFS